MVFNFSIEKYPFQEKESEKRWKGDGFAVKKWLESIDIPPIYVIIYSMEKQSEIVEFLGREPLLYADVAEGLRRGLVRVLFVSDCALLAINTAGFYLLCSTNLMGACTALRSLPTGELSGKLLIAHGNAAREAALSVLSVERETKCWQGVYQGKELPLKGELCFLPPDDNAVRMMQAVYRLETPETIEKMAKAGEILAAYLPDAENERKDFVGFIGSHADGSMGMLHVFDAYRRRGFAEEIESMQINLWLKKGWLPFGHVIDGNDASYRLQQKLGMSFATEWVTWMRIKE